MANKCEYSIYEDATPQEYRGCLEEQNQRYFEDITAILQPLEQLIINAGACIVLIGSDGKRERHPQSKSEVFVVQTPKGDLTAPMILNRIPKFTSHFEVGYDNLPCIRKMGDGLLSHSYGNPRFVYPDAILNSRLVFGSQQLHNLARQTIVSEMMLNDTKKQVKSQRNEYLIAATSGISRNRVSFKSGIAFYDEAKESATYGLKTFLRLTQRSLDVHMINLMKQGITLSASDLSSNTSERLEYFNFPEVNWISYMWFLQQYHHSQEQYKNSRQPVAVPYNTSQFEEYSSTILNLAGLIKSNQ